MDPSDEEEEFQSADEDGFEEEIRRKLLEGADELNQQQNHKADDRNRRCNDEVIKKAEVEPPSERKSFVSTIPTEQRSNHSITHEPKDSLKSESAVAALKVKKSDEQDDDEDEEDALAERIRERNIKLARKFSAELAKNIKTSAPIPVKTSKPDRQSEFSEDLDPLDDKLSVQPPPAPPSTPALSSSYSASSDPVVPSAGTSPSLNTQYNWRIPPKVTASQQQSSSSSSTPSKGNKPDEQARQVLDRLSQRLSQTDKNLFERVAADVKKVSLKDEEVPSSAAELPSTLPSITDLGSTLSGWGWSGATKILSSASQVTSHVSSVLDSVVGAVDSSAQQPDGASVQTRGNPSKPEDTTTSDDPKTKQALSDITYNDPLVDFTLNAMESLGKRAFDVMTSRDKTGSLQIKGLGRPWEHLLSNLKVEDTPGVDTQDEPVHNRSPSPPPIESEDMRVVTGAPEYRSDSPPPPSTLKLRKRRND